MRVELAYFPDCPHWRDAQASLLALQAEFDLEVDYLTIASPEAAAGHRFRGSPSISVNGEDLFGSPDQTIGLTCRRYPTPSGPAGSPTTEQIRRALAGMPPPVTGGGRT